MIYDDFELKLAKHICAAYLSVSMGLNSVDYTLKTYVNDKDDEDKIGEFWLDVARDIIAITSQTRKLKKTINHASNYANKEINQCLDDLLKGTKFVSNIDLPTQKNVGEARSAEGSKPTKKAPRRPVVAKTANRAPKIVDNSNRASKK